MKHNVDEIFEKVKYQRIQYDEERHCKKILEVMIKKGRVSFFCIEECVNEMKFYSWIKEHDLFAQCYALGKMYSREAWEEEGLEIRDEITLPGQINHRYEHWKMMGWSKFGISKNSKIKLNLDPKGNPSQHYSQLLLQASEGDFTAAEIKQLMEAINVGLNTHQVFELQKEIDQLKSDLATMVSNTNGNNTRAD